MRKPHTISGPADSIIKLRSKLAETAAERNIAIRTEEIMYASFEYGFFVGSGIDKGSGNTENWDAGFGFFCLAGTSLQPDFYTVRFFQDTDGLRNQVHLVTDQEEIALKAIVMFEHQDLPGVNAREIHFQSVSRLGDGYLVDGIVCHNGEWRKFKIYIV